MSQNPSFRSLAGLFCVLLYACPLHAQPFLRLACRHISTHAGLSDAYVRKVIQDPFGFIWVATDDGLNRFDGKNFTIYNTGAGSKHAISGNDIWDLALDSPRGLVWAVNSYGGIDAIDYRTGNTAYSYFQMQHKTTADLRFTCLSLCGNTLFIGSTAGLWTLDVEKKELKRIALQNPFDHPDTLLHIEQLAADPADRLWLFCKGAGVVLLKRTSRTIESSLGADRLGAPPAARMQFYDCARCKDGQVLAGTNFGLRRFRSGRSGIITCDADPFPGVPHTQRGDIYSCKQDSKGATWFCTSNCFMRIAPDGKMYSYIQENASRDEFRWLDAAFDIYFDRDDNLWLGCQQGLLFSVNRPAGFTCFYKSASSDASIRHAYFIYPVNDSLVYCSAQDGLYKVNTQTGSIHSLDTMPYYHVFLDPFNHLLASSPAGLSVLSGGRPIPIARVYPEFRSLPRIITNSHCAIGDSLILFGTHNEHGVIAWNIKSRKVTQINISSPGLHLKENAVTNVYQDPAGTTWVLGFNSVSMLDFRTNSMRSLNTYNASAGRSYSIFFDIAWVKGLYYLASYGGGVLVLDSQYHFIRQLTVDNGLASNSTYRLLPFRDSLLFVTSNNGLSVIDLQHAFQIRKFYASDGLHADNFEEYSGAVRKGIFYAGGGNGFTMIDPSRLPPPEPAPILFPRNLEIQTPAGHLDTAEVLLTSLKIPSDALQTTVSFSAFNYANPDRPSFSYRIKELKGGWIDMGKRDFINFIGQNPGTYTLEVRAANEEHSWSPTPLQLELTFLPKWYQTLLFKIAVILAIALSFYSLYRYRISQLKQQQLIRQNISSDLHDDIGSILNTIRIFTHLAKRSDTGHYLSQIEHSLVQAMTGLRDMIWVLDDSFDTIYELLERIRQFAAPIATPHNITLEISADESLYDKSLRKSEKRNLLLIAKESINNSLKYASCSKIKVHLAALPDTLQVQIEDDGVGFDAQQANKGNGLKNMHQRAAQIRYTITIDSAPGTGTRIILLKR